MIFDKVIHNFRVQNKLRKIYYTMGVCVELLPSIDFVFSDDEKDIRLDVLLELKERYGDRLKVDDRFGQIYSIEFRHDPLKSDYISWERE